MVKIETRCRIPIRQTFGRIQWHVIPEPTATLQRCCYLGIKCNDPRATYHVAGCCNRANSMACQLRAAYHIAASATWWIYWRVSRAKCHIAGCSHLAKSMSWSCHITGCKNSIRHVENRFSPYFISFLMQVRLWRAAAFVSSPIHLFYINNWSVSWWNSWCMDEVAT